ncbi:MAG: lytic murein transglycosylase [Acidobacteria bacterium]|nr:lytic murein transglycosylase [Acidobacteriota bacterium]
MAMMQTALLALALLQSPSSGETVPEATAPAAKTRISERVQYVISQLLQNGFAASEAEALFQDRRLEVLPPQQVAPRQIDWDQVIRTLVASGSVLQGSQFLALFQDTFRQAESRFGVEPALLTAVLRLESNLGKNTGNYVAFNVFYTLLSQQEEEKRWRWAGDNLAALATFCKNTGNDCFQIRGSYAGALGAAQFLPYSVLQFGADGDGDGIVDPFRMEDAIMSAANYLVVHGWHQDQTQALAKYYGSGQGYPRAVFAYAEALKAAAASSQTIQAAQP